MYIGSMHLGNLERRSDFGARKVLGMNSVLNYINTGSNCPTAGSFTPSQKKVQKQKQTKKIIGAIIGAFALIGTGYYVVKKGGFGKALESLKTSFNSKTAKIKEKAEQKARESAQAGKKSFFEKFKSFATGNKKANPTPQNPPAADSVVTNSTSKIPTSIVPGSEESILNNTKQATAQKPQEILERMKEKAQKDAAIIHDTPDVEKLAQQQLEQVQKQISKAGVNTPITGALEKEFIETIGNKFGDNVVLSKMNEKEVQELKNTILEYMDKAIKAKDEKLIKQLDNLIGEFFA